MSSYDILFDSENVTITIKYVQSVSYRTLLKSLNELYNISMLDRVGLILDFSELQTLRVGYQQIINFRQGLKTLLLRNKVNRIAIINPAELSLLDVVCSTAQNVENDFLSYPCSCFTVENTAEAYQLLH